MEIIASTHREPWNKGKLVGQKTPFKLKEIWGDPSAVADRESVPGSCSIQLGDRQQASGL